MGLCAQLHVRHLLGCRIYSGLDSLPCGVDLGLKVLLHCIDVWLSSFHCRINVRLSGGLSVFCVRRDLLLGDPHVLCRRVQYGGRGALHGTQNTLWLLFHVPCIVCSAQCFSAVLQDTLSGTESRACKRLRLVEIRCGVVLSLCRRSVGLCTGLRLKVFGGARSLLSCSITLGLSVFHRIRCETIGRRQVICTLAPPTKPCARATPAST